MSHFSVLCIGQNIDKQLAKYNEQDELFCIHVDQTKSFLEDYEKYKNDEDFLKKYPSASKSDFAKWWTTAKIVSYDDELPEGSCAVTDENGDVVTYYAYFNPNAKYDYYMEDGYAIFPLKKDGHFVNRAKKGDIDFDKLYNQHDAENIDFYRKAISCIPEGIDAKDCTSWAEFLKLVDSGELTIEEAREKYHDQRIVVMFETNSKSVFGNDYWFGFGFDIVELARQTEEEYVNANKTAICYAFVKDGIWYERGQMGWWGMSYGDKDKDVWRNEVMKMIDELPDYAMLTMLDCHI